MRTAAANLWGTEVPSITDLPAGGNLPRLMAELRARGFVPTCFSAAPAMLAEGGQGVLVRLDAEWELKQALRDAEAAADLEVPVTVFVAVQARTFNPFGFPEQEILRRILALGHEVGLLHPPATLDESPERYQQGLCEQASRLALCLGTEVRSAAAMLRPVLPSPPICLDCPHLVWEGDLRWAGMRLFGWHSGLAVPLCLDPGAEQRCGDKRWEPAPATRCVELVLAPEI